LGFFGRGGCMMIFSSRAAFSPADRDPGGTATFFCA
jgi:hypothetical protein